MIKNYFLIGILAMILCISCSVYRGMDKECKQKTIQFQQLLSELVSQDSLGNYCMTSPKEEELKKLLEEVDTCLLEKPVELISHSLNGVKRIDRYNEKEQIYSLKIWRCFADQFGIVTIKFYADTTGMIKDFKFSPLDDNRYAKPILVPTH